MYRNRLQSMPRSIQRLPNMPTGVDFFCFPFSSEIAMYSTFEVLGNYRVRNKLAVRECL